jgi:ATP-binding cassette subfamily B protein
MSVIETASAAGLTRATADALNGPTTLSVKAMPKVLSRIAVLAMDYKWRLGLSLACTIGSTAFGLINPKLFGYAIDQAQSLLTHSGDPGKVHRALAITALLVIGASFVRGSLQLLSGYYSEWVSQRVAYDLRLRLFQKLQTLSFSFHDRIHSGDLISRAMLDIEGTRMFISGAMVQMFSVVLLAAMASYLMFATEPDLAWKAMLFAPLAGWRLARLGVLLRVTFLHIQQLMSLLTLTMEENLQGIRVVRAFAAKAFEMAKFDKVANDALTLSFRRINLRFSNVATMNVLFYLSQGLLLYFGLHRVLAGTLTVGRLTEFMIYMTMLQAPVRQIAMIFMAAARAASSGGRIFEILDLKPEIVDAPHAEPLKAPRGVLKFEHVGFKYDADGPQILEDISFEVQPGKTIGVIGPPGSGKTTIANLIPRFYDVTSGKITIDGQDIRNVTLASLRAFTGLVQQEAFMFDATVSNNLAYADPWADEPRLVDAATTAQIHDYLKNLPDAYETRVGERGVALSGGQRQRVSIARGIITGPGVMIFDDSTAAIDAVTERRVREALSAATSAKATIIIAHRLTSLMHADEIIVLDESGRIAERGDHASLLAAGGRYAELYELQSKAGSDLEDQSAAEEERV